MHIESQPLQLDIESKMLYTNSVMQLTVQTCDYTMWLLREQSTLYVLAIYEGQIACYISIYLQVYVLKDQSVFTGRLPLKHYSIWFPLLLTPGELGIAPLGTKKWEMSFLPCRVWWHICTWECRLSRHVKSLGSMRHCSRLWWGTQQSTNANTGKLW